MTRVGTVRLVHSRLTEWRRRAPRLGPGATLAAEAGLVAAAAAFRVVQPRVPPRLASVVNVSGALACLGVARYLGASPSDLGVGRDRARRGALVGLGAAAVVTGATAIAYAIPYTREHFVGHVKDGRRRMALLETLVNIPFGTAFSEEIVFRGAIHGLALRRFGLVGAIATDVTLFGLWHLGDHGAARDALPSEQHPVVAALATVGATGAAGAVFSGLRVWSGSVLAPMLAHDALNVAGYLAAWRTTRRANGANGGRANGTNGARPLQ